ncbi:unnamed protein product [Closterium sp. Naga37s-1]|nr:unnamed protein product [Closterium sp. Naga37s-1]
MDDYVASASRGVGGDHNGMHFALTALTGVASACAGLVPRQLSVPLPVLLGFALLGNASLVATNLSLLLNSVGFYQISKVSIIPTVCFFEAVFKGRTFTPRVKAAVAVVMLGVALCTVSEIHVNPLGLAVAAFAVLCSAMHMMLIGLLQERYSIGSFDLLSQSAPLQAFMLLLVGPSLDLFLTSRSLLDYHYQPNAIVFIILSCCLAVVCNLSAYLCIGKFSASTYQVLGHMKTVLVLVLGVVLFDSSISLKGILGMCIAVTGMVMYGHATATQASASGAGGGGGGTVVTGIKEGRGRGEAGLAGREESEREEIPLLSIVVGSEDEDEEEEAEEEDERDGEKGLPGKQSIDDYRAGGFKDGTRRAEEGEDFVQGGRDAHSKPSSEGICQGGSKTRGPIQLVIPFLTMEEVTDEQFREVVLENPRPAIVVFYNPRITSSVSTANLVAELSKRFSDKLAFYKVDIHTYDAYADRYAGSDESSAVVLFKNGEAVKKVTSAPTMPDAGTFGNEAAVTAFVGTVARDTSDLCSHPASAAADA